MKLSELIDLKIRVSEALGLLSGKDIDNKNILGAYEHLKQASELLSHANA